MEQISDTIKCSRSKYCFVKLFCSIHVRVHARTHVRVYSDCNMKCFSMLMSKILKPTGWENSDSKGSEWESFSTTFPLCGPGRGTSLF